MTQSKDGVGNQSLFHLGTELTLLGGMRSTMESIIIPSIVLIFSIVMFVNYGVTSRDRTLLGVTFALKPC